MMGQEGQENPNILDNSKEVTPGAAPDPAKTGENAQPVENMPNPAENEPKVAQEPVKNESVKEAESTSDTNSQNAEEKSSDPDVKFSSVKNDEKTNGAKTEETEKKHPWEILPTDDTDSKDSNDTKDKEEKTHKNLFAKKQKLTKEEKLEKKKLAKEKRKASLAKFKTWTKKHKALTAVICVVIIAAVIGVGTGVKWTASQNKTIQIFNEDDEDDEYEVGLSFPEGTTIENAETSPDAFMYSVAMMEKAVMNDVFDENDEVVSYKLKDNIVNFINNNAKNDYEKRYYYYTEIALLCKNGLLDDGKKLLDENRYNYDELDNRTKYAYYESFIIYYTENDDEQNADKYKKELIQKVPNTIYDTKGRKFNTQELDESLI